MATTYNYYKPGASLSGCPGTAIEGGWYEQGSSNVIVSDYLNPETGAAYTPQELAGYGGGGGSGGETATSTTTTPSTGTQGVWFEGQYLGDVDESFAGLDQAGQEAWIKDNFGVDVSGQGWGFGGAPGGEGQHGLPSTTPGTTTPTFGEGAGAGVPTPEVTPAPPYEISPEQQAFEDMYGGQLTDWVEAGGYGIPEETQNLMIQQQTDSLKAREQESIRVMRNNMERRGITNSGFLYANEQTIRSNTTVAIAGAIADVQIKSALMKMASFEKAMGAAAQFLGYLSEQSQLAYAPEFATWQAEQMATMQAWQAEQMATLQAWQAKLDIYKMELNQAYQTQNMQLQAQLQSQLNQEQNAFDLQLAEMEIEANQQIAMAQGIGGIFGTVLGFIFGK